MASSYSTDLKLELMVTGENAGTWGDKTNTNLNLIQQAVAGFEQITLSSGGTVALTMSDGAISTARNLVIKFATATIAASTVCTIPDSIEKFYIFDCSGLTNANNLTIKTASGTGFSPTTAGAASSKIFAAYSDGTNLNEISLNTLGGTIATAQLEASSVTTSIIADDAVTSAKIADDAVVAAGIADGAVGTAAIADDAVTADKLANTAVSAGDYTAASITVDAQGRVTAASSGSAGVTPGATKIALFANGPSSGTYTAPSNSSSIQAFLFAAGGGGGGGFNGQTGQAGGRGGFGIYYAPTPAPYAKAYAVGAPGSPGTQGIANFGQAGSSGGATSITDVGTTNAGNGGTRGGPGSQTPGNSGDAPGATLTYPTGFIDFGLGIHGGDAGAAGNTRGNGGAGGAGMLVIFEGAGS